MYSTAITFLFFKIVLVSGLIYYVHPNGDDSSCPNQSNNSCYTLDYYYRKDYFNSNTTFYFIEGTHIIPSHQTYLIFGVTNLTLQGLGRREQGFHETVMQSTTIITCESRTSNIIFMFSSNITLKLLTIKQCGRYLSYSSQILNYVQLHLLKERTAAVSIVVDNATVVAIEVYNLFVYEFSVLNNSGYGLLALNAFNVEIYSSSFSQNNLNTFIEGCPLIYCHGANLAILYTNPFRCPSSPPIYKASVINTNVSFSTNLDFPTTGTHDSAGLLVFMEQAGGVYGVDVVIDNVVAYGNTALNGANMAVIVMSDVTYYTVSISHLYSGFGNMIFPLASSGNASVDYAAHSGLSVLTGIATRISQRNCGFDGLQYANVPLQIKDSTFLHNFGGHTGALGITYFQGENLNLLQHVFIKNVHLSGNIGFLGIGISLFGQSTGIGAPISYVMENVSIENSLHNPSANPYNNFTGSALFLFSVYNVTINGLSVKNSDANGALVLNSAIVVTGKDNYFVNNTGYKGGGIAFYGNSFLILFYPAVISFIDNHATETGGAIFVDLTSQIQNYCVLQVTLGPDNIVNEDHGVRCINNTAVISGSLLYGGNIDYCNLLPNSWIINVVPSGSALFNITFQYFSSNDSNISVIASDAVRACFCNQLQPDCSLDTVTINAYPGEIINIPAITVGQRFGATTGTLKVVEITEGHELGLVLTPWQPHCQNFTYTVHVESHPELILATTLKMSAVIESTPNVPTALEANITVNITILDCPPGFEFSQNSGECTCHNDILVSLSTTKCNASSQIISKQGDVWIGYNSDDRCVIAHQNCPFDYCSMSAVNFNISNPDSQCALNRSGLLCGECANGLSLLLGSNKCGTCSNSYLGLLIVFAIFGIGLVVFLLVLNFTISLGMINGLIFFANIIKLNEAVFFPAGPIHFLSQFISWLNLDLGIETCFYNGMDSYAKVWLQFIFPFYIWVIIIIIIYLAKYTKFSRLVSNNTVPVLATLMLLSYTKLIRTVTLALASVTIKCGQHSTQYSWYNDPNIDYLSLKHVILLVFALFVLCFLIIPFTVLLVFMQLLEGPVRAIRRCNFWYKLKPFFDAFGGPFKDKYRFWPGLLLVVRLVLLLIVSFNNSKSTTAAAITTCIAILLALFAIFGGIYKKLHTNVLEITFLLLLTTMSAFNSINDKIATPVGLSIAFIVFVVIVAFHCYLRMENWTVVVNVRNKLMKKQNSTDKAELVIGPSCDDARMRMVLTQSAMTELFANREPLIFDDNEGGYYVRKEDP